MRSNAILVKMKMYIPSIIFIIGIFAIPTITQAQQADISWTECGITRKAFMTEAAAAYKNKTGITFSSPKAA